MRRIGSITERGVLQTQQARDAQFRKYCIHVLFIVPGTHNVERSASGPLRLLVGLSTETLSVHFRQILVAFRLLSDKNQDQIK